MTLMNSATKKAITTEYRNAKSAVESLVGVKPIVGLQDWLRACKAQFEAPCLPLEIRNFYAIRGGTVDADASRTLAYARLARAFEALEAMYTTTA